MIESYDGFGIYKQGNNPEKDFPNLHMRVRMRKCTCMGIDVRTR